MLLVPSSLLHFSLRYRGVQQRSIVRLILNQRRCVDYLATRPVRSQWLHILESDYAKKGHIIRNDDPFMKAMIALSYTDSQREKILGELQAAGLIDSLSSNTLHILTMDLKENSTSAMLIEDFGISPLVAHLTRAALQYSRNMENDDSDAVSDDGSIVIEEEEEWRGSHSDIVNGSVVLEKDVALEENQLEDDFISDLPMNSIFSSSVQFVTHQPWINKRDPLFEVQQRSSAIVGSTLYPWKIHMELYYFLLFMRLPSTEGRGEAPLNAKTAQSYLRYVKLFLSWYYDFYLPENVPTHNVDKANLSIYKIFLSKKKEHTSSILACVLWLRQYNDISVSCESTFVYSLLKLLKWRFHKESFAGDKFGSTFPKRIFSFVEFPVIQEIRELPREAIDQQTLAVRVSHDDFKCQHEKVSICVDESPIASDLSTLTKTVAPAVALKDEDVVQCKTHISKRPLLENTKTWNSNNGQGLHDTLPRTYYWYMYSTKYANPNSQHDLVSTNEDEAPTLENAKICDATAMTSFMFCSKYANPILVVTKKDESANSSEQKGRGQRKLYYRPKLAKMKTDAAALKYDDMMRCKTRISSRPILENVERAQPKVLAVCNTISKKCNLVDLFSVAAVFGIIALLSN